MGQQSWDTAKEACWKQDAMPELHNDDDLWAYLMWVSEELRMMDCSRLMIKLYCVSWIWGSSIGRALTNS